jgi:dihydroneopterin aldolase
MTTDTVSIRDLNVAAVIGVHDWERDIEQTLIFTVDMAADVRKPAATDDLSDALNYSAVAATITAVVCEGKFRLIETAAERVAERLLADYPIAWLRLELRKPITAGAYTAAITIERTPATADRTVERTPATADRTVERTPRTVERTSDIL